MAVLRECSRCASSATPTGQRTAVLRECSRDALFERELPLTARAYLGAAITLSGLGVNLRRR